MTVDEWSPVPSPRRFAPEAFSAFDALDPARRRAIAPELVDRIRSEASDQLGAAVIASIPASASAPETEARDRAVSSFTQQFVVDVSSISAEQRAAFLAQVGRDAFALVQVIWVTDFGIRTEAAWRQLFDEVNEPRPDLDASTGPDLWPAMEAFMAAVARLDRLDPLTTELVRLRGARAHNCRLCRSLRHVRAVEDGADESTFDQIDDYEHGDLSERHRVALRLTDAMLWTPITYPVGLVDQVRDAFAPSEVVELVLDVTRNTANKIAVALGADEARVTDGVEFYDIGADGELVYGMTPA